MDTLATAENLREQAKRFQAAAQKLMEAAEVLNGIKTSAAQLPKKRNAGKRSGKAQELHEFLSTNGPMRRKDILARSGLRPGTIATVLREKYGFLQDHRGRWYVPKEKTQAMGA